MIAFSRMRKDALHCIAKNYLGIQGLFWKKLPEGSHWDFRKFRWGYSGHLE